MAEVARTRLDVRFGSKADMRASQHDVRFTPKSGHFGARRCPQKQASPPDRPLCHWVLTIPLSHPAMTIANPAPISGSERNQAPKIITMSPLNLIASILRVIIRFTY
jgi:hypothetical protein